MCDLSLTQLSYVFFTLLTLELSMILFYKDDLNLGVKCETKKSSLILKFSKFKNDHLNLLKKTQQPTDIVIPCCICYLNKTKIKKRKKILMTVVRYMILCDNISCRLESRLCPQVRDTSTSSY